MKRLAIGFGIVALAAIVMGSGTPALAGSPQTDGRTCFKAKDLKDPAAFSIVPNPVTVDTVVAGMANCTLGKLRQVCVASNVGSDSITESGAHLCCFKPKCAPALTPSLTGYGIADSDSGAGDFSGSAILKAKPASVCIACRFLAF